ncbi:MAG TPA: aldehyde ferredoxin oxidoreductase family protein [Firmicutes bacterium]|nr:aldehyde ferredoxin oxidoreductase family protein [Bacillota bacterium]
MTAGYFDRVLWVDLGTGRTESRDMGEGFWRTYLGGSGVGTRILYDEVPPGVDPLGPDNCLVFAVGPYQRSGLPGSAKWAVVGKSPLTGTFAVSTGGAEWGVRLKGTGREGIVVKGKADCPSLLWVTEQGIEIRPAPSLWGRDAVETVTLACREVGDEKASVVTIGPAGERGVAIACICADGHSFAGRCGLGAVMGAKNLKAIVVSGNLRPSVADPDELRKVRGELASRLARANRESTGAHGTAISVADCEAVGDLPVKYWRGERWPEGAARIGAPRFTDYLHARPWPCSSCPVGCHRRIDLEGKYRIEGGAGPEYESLGMLGSCCLVDDLEAVARANDLCNRLGIDTISAGSHVAFTMECFENGWITKADLDGWEARWGSGDFLVHLVEQIGTRRGFGTLFARGIRAAAQAIGQGAEGITVEVKGLDFPAHDPRTYFSLAVNYATGTRGACHLRGFPHAGEAGMVIPEVGFESVPLRFSMEGQAQLARLFQDYATALDSLVCCMFMQTTGQSLGETVAALNAITGWDMTAEEFLRVGERVFNLQRVINVGDGIGRQDDRLPPKMFEPAREGFRAGRIPEPFESTLLGYYRLRGWDENGRPLPSTLAELGLPQQ